MIALSRLNGTGFYLNPDLLFTVEATPDTVITLTNGEKLLVHEPPDEVVRRFVAYKRDIAAGPA